MQTRTYPNAHGGLVRQAGWELVLALGLVEAAPRVAWEAVELLTAPPCPSGPVTLVLGAEQLALQVHESIGHALELDRMQLLEAAYAGTSWVGVGDVGALVYVDAVQAAPHVYLDKTALGADFVAVSAYTWCGPHVGAVVADPALLSATAGSQVGLTLLARVGLAAGLAVVLLGTVLDRVTQAAARRSGVRRNAFRGSSGSWTTRLDRRPRGPR